MSNVGLEILAGNKVQSKAGSLGGAATDITVGVKQGPRGQGKVMFGDTLQPFSQHPAPPSLAEVSLSISVMDGYDGVSTQAYSAVNLDQVASYNGDAGQLYPYAGNPGYGYVIDPLQSGIGKSWDIETVFDGDFISFGHTNIVGNVNNRIWINEMEIGEWIDRTALTGPAEVYNTKLPITTSPVAFYYTNVKFPDYGQYRIRYAGPGIFFGITANANQVMRPARRRLKAMVISDSWWEMTMYGSSMMGVEWKTQTGHDVINLAWGGTGYIKGSELTPQRHYNSANRRAAIAARIHEADYIILNGSTNDWTFSEAAVMEAMAELVEYIGTLRPNIPIYVVGLEDSYAFVTLTGQSAAWMEARENNLMDFMETLPQVAGVYRSCNDNTLTGTGNAGAPNGTGNQDYFICNDEIHLMPAGARSQVAHTVAAFTEFPIFLEEVA